MPDGGHCDMSWPYQGGCMPLGAGCAAVPAAAGGRDYGMKVGYEDTGAACGGGVGESRRAG